MANAYVDVPVPGSLRPYVGAGFGKAWISHDLDVDGAVLAHASSWPWAWQVMAGASLPLAPHWAMGLEYRYLGSQRGLFQDTQGLFYRTGYDSHNVMLTLTWRP